MQRSESHDLIDIRSPWGRLGDIFNANKFSVGILNFFVVVLDSFITKYSSKNQAFIILAVFHRSV